MTTETKLAMVPRWTRAQLELLKRTIAKGTTDDEFSLFIYVAKATGLDPFREQIHAIKRWDAESSSYIMKIQTSVHGYRLLAERTGERAGTTPAEFTIDENEPWHPKTATVTVYRMKNGEKIPYTKTVRWSEYAQKKKDGTYTRMWSENGMPFNQLEKCAEVGALRLAFPAELAGIVAREEMPVIDTEEVRELKDVTPGSSGDPSSPPPPPDNLIAGTLIAYAPKTDKKRTHTFTFRTDEGAELSLTCFERPASIGKTDPTTLVGKRCQFKYEEKPGQAGKQPFRNLVHFALEPETKPAEERAPETKPAEANGSEDHGRDFYVSVLDSAQSELMLKDLWNSISAEITNLSDDDRKAVMDHFKKRNAELKGK